MRTKSKAFLLVVRDLHGLETTSKLFTFALNFVFRSMTHTHIHTQTWYPVAQRFKKKQHPMMRGAAAHIRKLGDVLAGTHLFCSRLVLLPVLLQLFVDTLKEKTDMQWLQSNSERSARVCECVFWCMFTCVCGAINKCVITSHV